MGVRLSLVSALTLVAASTIFAGAAPAQERPATFKPRETIPNAIDRAFDSRISDYRDTKETVESIIGVVSYPENSIARDVDHVHRIYIDALTQQVSSDPLIRTADLPNPFNTSVLTLPSANVSSQVVGSELVFEKLP